jgi:MFS family permease
MRWVVIFLAFLAIAINYIDRANLAVAAPQIEKALGIGPAEMGFILSGFFWSYALMQMPFGWFVDRVGARIALPLAVGWWSVFTALTAVATSVAGMFGCRLMLGIGEAGAYPSCAKLVSQWFRKEQRAFATSIFDSGSRVGSALSIPVVALIISSFGWEASFVITGVIGFVWILGWFLIYRNKSTGDLTGETDAAPVQPVAPRTKVSWASLFKYRTLWGMMLGFFCLNFVIYFFITWFPTYLTDARGFSLLKTGIYGVIPSVVAIFGGWLGGWVSDRIYDRTGDLNKARKTCLVGGMLFSSVIALAVVVPSAAMALVLLSISYASLTFAAASVWSLPADVSPTQSHVASLGGIQNFASNLAGVGSPFFVGALYDATGSFVVPLVVVGCFALVGAAAYALVIKKVEPLPLLRKATGSAVA